MPFTTYHLGPALLVGVITLPFLDFPTFLIANVIIDIEPLLIILLDLGYPPHRFFHTLLGGTLAAFLLAGVMLKLRRYLSSFLTVFKLESSASSVKIVLASLSGIYAHVLLDSTMHKDLYPFYPSLNNPFLDSLPSAFSIYRLCVWAGFGGFVLYLLRVFVLWIFHQTQTYN
jgi:hypothetical protein